MLMFSQYHNFPFFKQKMFVYKQTETIEYAKNQATC